MAEKLDAIGVSRKKAFESVALLAALCLIYSVRLSVSLDRTSCPVGDQEIPLNLALVLPILKFLLFYGWPFALIAGLDATWQSKDAARVTLAAYAVTSVYWIRHYGAGFCPPCVILGLLPFIFSAAVAHKLGSWAGSWIHLRRAGKYLIIAGTLLAGFAALALINAGAHEAHPPEMAAAPSKNSATVQPVSVPATDRYGDTVQKVMETPHFWQLDPRGGFANHGLHYCGPVAISDSLVYLAHHGLPDLLTQGENALSQIDMINLLASPHYLGSVSDNGTGPSIVLSGIEKYVVGHGYQCTTMEYEGWPKVGRREQQFVKGTKPDLDWIKKGIVDPHGAVWLCIGWYDRAGDGRWKYSGGHWVPMVGFDATNPRALLIHNPGTPGNGEQPDDPAKDVIYLQPVATGTLDTGEWGMQDAGGMYQLSGPGLPKGNDVVAFLDAAIVVVVNKL